MGTMVGIAVCAGNKRAVTSAESEPTGIMTFADPNVQAICAKTWGDGTNITYEQAALVTSLGTTFSKNTTITSFDELGKFGVTSLADGRYGVFVSCSNLVSVDLSKITIIGSAAFLSCPLFAGDGNGDLRIPNLTSIGNNSFGGYNRGTCTGLKRVLDLGSITTIPDDTNQYQGTFRNQLNLTDVILPETLTKIGNRAFSGCTSLANINFPLALASIGNNAFSRCSSMEGVKLPSTVTTIGTSAFQYCTGLTRVSIAADTPPTLGSSAFANCTALTGIYVPDESVEAYKTATNWSAYANIILPLSQFNG